jgi:peptidoglycan/xylan/chitin deacetylase (PgdA/CDA1 family)
MTPAAIYEELGRTQYILLRITGKKPRFFRPPYGELNTRLLRVAYQMGLYTVQYDVPTGDPDENLSLEHLVGWTSSQLQAGSILLMHMNRPNNETPNLLERLMPILAQHHLEPVTISKLFFEQ